MAQEASPEREAPGAAPLQTERPQEASPQAGEENLEHHEQAIFDKLGGWTSLQLAVDLFYDKLLGDELLEPYFRGMDVRRLRRKQIMFMSFAFGGTKAFYGQHIAYAHRELILKQGLNLTHYDAVAGHFVATLTELGVPGHLIAEAAAVVLTTRPMFDPTAVFEQVASFKAQVQAPVASNLMALQKQLQPTLGHQDETDAQRQQRSLSSASSSSATTIATAPDVILEAAAAPPGAAGGGAGGGATTVGVRRVRMDLGASVERVKVSTLAEVFSSQVLGDASAKAFSAARANSRSDSTAARLTLEADAAGGAAGHDSNSTAAAAGGQPAEDCTAADGALAARKSVAAGSSEPSTDAAEAKRLRRKMMKDILRGLGVLPTDDSSAISQRSSVSGITVTPKAAAATDAASGGGARMPAAGPTAAAASSDGNQKGSGGKAAVNGAALHQQLEQVAQQQQQPGVPSGRSGRPSDSGSSSSSGVSVANESDDESEQGAGVMGVPHRARPQAPQRRSSGGGNGHNGTRRQGSKLEVRAASGLDPVDEHPEASATSPAVAAAAAAAAPSS